MLMYSKFYLLLLAIIIHKSVSAAGEIAFTSIQAIDDDQFTFVTLVDLPVGFELNFTDMGYTSAGVRVGNEGLLRWTSPGTILSAGTQVTITLPSPSTPVASVGSIAAIGSSSFALSTAGDQITAFFIQSGTGNEIPVAAVHFGSNGFNGDPVNGSSPTSQTQLPPGLTLGTNAIDLGNRDAARYNCTGGTTSGDAANQRTTINNVANWTTSNTTVLTPPVSTCIYSITNPALPVKLKYFKGEAQLSQIILYWESTEESDLESYYLQKSRDAKNFENITQSSPKGESFYTIADNNPYEGINYYRLKQKFFDGQIKYTKILAVEWSSHLDFVNIYPNPLLNANELKIEKSENLDLKGIFNQSGQLVSEIRKPGSYTFLFENSLNKTKIAKKLIVN